MIKHIVMWKLKDSAEGTGKAENAAVMKQKLESLRNEIPGLKSIEAGIGIEHPGSTWDIVLYTEFDSQAELDAYQVHPLHQEAGKFIKMVTESRAAVDYTL